jgi:hypothetical protein
MEFVSYSVRPTVCVNSRNGLRKLPHRLRCWPHHDVGLPLGTPIATLLTLFGGDEVRRWLVLRAWLRAGVRWYIGGTWSGIPDE